MMTNKRLLVKIAVTTVSGSVREELKLVTVDQLPKLAETMEILIGDVVINEWTPRGTLPIRRHGLWTQHYDKRCAEAGITR